MWLLSTARAELKFFPSVQAAQIACFAILSHVWDETEQTFQQTQALHELCLRTNSNPRDLSTAKVRESCKLAEQHGYEWIWNDACCIDKTSSSELSEAINSMFSYYAHADVCYAYLKDVPPDCQLNRYRTEFWESRWFKRGWTLQELLAPQVVIFLSSAWTMLGTKESHAPLVSESTSIPEDVLLLQKEISATSIAERMSWASYRETTRPEDEAYCLMGIFNVHMPPLYGEGRRAFQRLQEEIMKKSVDTSLYAWCRPDSKLDPEHNKPGRLLATSPQQFRLSTGIVFSPNALYTLYDDVVSDRMEQQDQTSQSKGPLDATRQSTAYPSQLSGIPTFDITPYGIRAHLPIVTTNSQREVAILFASYRGTLLYFLLEKCDTAADPTRPLYHISRRIRYHMSIGPKPLPMLLEEYREEWFQSTAEGRERWDQFLSAPWRTVYFAHSPPESLSTMRIPLNHSLTTPFHIPPGKILTLTQRHFGMQLVGATLSAVVWQTPQLTLALKDDMRFSIRLHLGLCAASESSSRRGHHWAVLEWQELVYFVNGGASGRPGLSA